MTQQGSLHRMLLLRLALVAALIAAAAGFVAVRTEKGRIRQVARDRILIRTGTLQALAADRLEGGAPLDPEGFRTLLRMVSYKGTDLGVGHWVLLRVLDPGGREVAEVLDPAHDAVQRMAGRLRATPFLPPAGPGLAFEPVRLEGRFYHHARIALLDRQGRTAAHVEGLFAVSPDESRTEAWLVVRAAAMASGAVLAAALILYPVILRLLQRLERLSRHLLESNLEALGMLGSAIAQRDSDTDLHNFRVTLYAVRIAEAMGLDEARIRVLIRGAFLHDVGKIGVPDAILNKPGRLTPEEFEEMKKHVAHGVEIVRRSSWLIPTIPIVGGHHEKVDGSGYPRGRECGEIDLLARIFAVADVFDALTSRRPYKEPLGFEAALEILREGRGTHFDAGVLEAFEGVAGELYARTANREDDQPRVDLAAVQERYYRVPIGRLLRETRPEPA